MPTLAPIKYTTIKIPVRHVGDLTTAMKTNIRNALLTADVGRFITDLGTHDGTYVIEFEETIIST